MSNKITNDDLAKAMRKNIVLASFSNFKGHYKELLFHPYTLMYEVHAFDGCVEERSVISWPCEAVKEYNDYVINVGIEEDGIKED